MPTTLLLALRRSSFLRRLLSLVGYLGGAATLVLGGWLFYADAALSDTTMLSGFVMTGGIMAMFGTHELRVAIRNDEQARSVES